MRAWIRNCLVRQLLAGGAPGQGTGWRELREVNKHPSCQKYTKTVTKTGGGPTLTDLKKSFKSLFIYTKLHDKIYLCTRCFLRHR